MAERRNLRRRNFSYYMRVVDDATQELVGHLSDISPRGFRLDCPQPLALGKDHRLRMDLTGEVSDRPHISFVARTKWCRPDELDPFVHNVGFEISTISLVDGEIFQRIVEKYGSS